MSLASATDAKLDAAGELHKILFTWENAGNEKHKSWDNTILGHLRIEGRRLTAEVNSENRAMKFRALMEELLPGKARYKTTVIESPQAMLAQALKGNNVPINKSDIHTRLPYLYLFVDLVVCGCWPLRRWARS